MKIMNKVSQVNVVVNVNVFFSYFEAYPQVKKDPLSSVISSASPAKVGFFFPLRFWFFRCFFPRKNK